MKKKLRHASRHQREKEKASTQTTLGRDKNQLHRTLRLSVDIPFWRVRAFVC